MKRILLLSLLFSLPAFGAGTAPRIDTIEVQNLPNYIINGDITFNQRGPITSIGDGVYFVDRFQYGKIGTTVHNAGVGIDAPTLAQSGHQSTYSASLTLTTPDTSIAAGDLVLVSHKVEGYNWAQLAGKSFTLSFWVKHTATGTYSVALRNSARTASYVTTYTVNSSETWEKKTLTFPTPTTGTWLYDNGIGIEIDWVIAAGTDFQASTLNSWQAVNKVAASTQVNGVNTGATYFRLAQVMLNEGTKAAPFKMAGGDVQGELAKCQRYYETITAPQYVSFGIGHIEANTAFYGTVRYSQKRTTPSTITYTGTLQLNGAQAPNISSVTVFAKDAQSVLFQGTTVSATNGPGEFRCNSTTCAILIDAEL